YDRSANKVAALRPRLAEALDLLRDIKDAPGGGRFRKHIEAALSASAEPSAPIERDQGIPGTSFQRLNMLANQGE
ncbi:hypothetical protein, partial [Pseudomonas sp. 2835]|uniref:hypothetical protein n=1 Tax=Pseudomonas sp. 2835 TaxID=3156451 RepID=UPI003D25F761